MGRKGKAGTDDPQDEGVATEVPEPTKQKIEVEEEKNGAQTEGKYFQYRIMAQLDQTRSLDFVSSHNRT
jgi:hypothetical protein